MSTTSSLNSTTIIVTLVIKKSFLRSLDEWLSFAQSHNGPLVFVGLPAHPSASSGAIQYRSPRELKAIYEVCHLHVHLLFML